jgi:cardiolipin synthase
MPPPGEAHFSSRPNNSGTLLQRALADASERQHLFTAHLPARTPIIDVPGTERVELLDGGRHAYPRMLDAISIAKSHVYLEVYSFALDKVGRQFVDALSDAAMRNVAVHVILDGWGSAFSASVIAAELRATGCKVQIYNRLLGLLRGRFARTHRKMLLVDDSVAFIGGINIGDENTFRAGKLGWADLALELRGPPCVYLGRLFRGEPRGQLGSALQIYFSRLGEGWRLRRVYLKAISHARHRLLIAHGYFLPDRGVIRALVAAARRGVCVQLVLAGRSDVPLALAATKSLYRRLLSVGVSIHEWSGSVLHAKVAAIDGRQLLIGSFNLDPFSLTNREVLVEVNQRDIAAQGEAWIAQRMAEAHAVSEVEVGTLIQRWLLEPLGLLIARIALSISRLSAPSRRRRQVRRKHGRKLPDPHAPAEQSKANAAP